MTMRGSIGYIDLVETTKNSGVTGNRGATTSNHDLNHRSNTGDKQSGAYEISARSGYAVVKPGNSAMSSEQNRGTFKCEMTSRNNNYDKQSGTYKRETAKTSISNGDYYNHGRTGQKAEFKVSSTVRVGDKRGYTEYSNQAKVTRVNYDNNGKGSNSGGKSCNNYGGNSGDYNKNYGGSIGYNSNSNAGSDSYYNSYSDAGSDSYYNSYSDAGSDSYYNDSDDY